MGLQIERVHKELFVWRFAQLSSETIVGHASASPHVKITVCRWKKNLISWKQTGQRKSFLMESDPVVFVHIIFCIYVTFMYLYLCI